MKIEINEYDSPHTLRALAALLITWANASELDKSCEKPCYKPGPFPDANFGEAVTATPEPLEIFPSEVIGGTDALSASKGIIGSHEARTFSHAPVVPPPVQNFNADRDVLRIVTSADPQGGAPVPATVVLVPPPPPPNEAAEPDYSAAAGYAPAPRVPTDKTGAPWDARIHSSSKALVADGTWRLKRGVDKSLLKAGEEVLRVLDTALVPLPRSPVQFSDPHKNAEIAPGFPPLVPPPPPPPPPPLGAAPLPPETPMPFNEISRFFAVHCMAGKLAHADMEAMAKHVGLEFTQDLINSAHADKRPAALAYLQGLVDQRNAKSTRE